MRTKLIVIATIFINSFFINAQEGKFKKADKEYNQYAFVNAIETYEKVAKKGYKSVELFEKLGNANYFQGKLQEANNWYTELFSLNEDLEAEYYFRYAQTLKSVGDYKKANQMMAVFYQKNQLDSRGNLAKSQKDYLEEIKKNSGRYQIKNAGINSVYSDYGSSFYKDQLVFASARDTGSISNRKHDWNNQSYTNLYSVKTNGNEISSTNVAKFSKETTTKYHESTPVFSKDGNTMYFTRNNFLNGKKGIDTQNTILLKVYRATKKNNNWTNVEELPFNSNDYSVAHPALSTDEKTLYFASDMPGTKGQSDIFKVDIHPDGSFGTPINLGDKFNTEGKETFPFISGANELFFASDGYPGLGGLDVFVTRLNKDGNPTKVRNVGKPVNSSMDDFAYVIDSKMKIGYVTSNRKDDNLGYDDIYKFVETRPLPEDCDQILTGIVIDLDSKNPIKGAKVTLYDINGNLTKELYADELGRYDFGPVDCNTLYKIRSEAPLYNTNEIIVTIPKDSGKTESLIPLELTQKPLQPGDDLRKALGIDIIYFDLDKSNIRKDAAVELAKVAEVMKQYPNMHIDIRSHTDCRQTKAYNEALSERRAKATLQWLVKNGIEKNRLTAKGYGESQLVNDCGCEPTNKSNCSEEQHQKNRRSEFIIVKL